MKISTAVDTIITQGFDDLDSAYEGAVTYFKQVFRIDDNWNSLSDCHLMHEKWVRGDCDIHVELIGRGLGSGCIGTAFWYEFRAWVEKHYD
jgi:hypothetical protein